MNLEAVVALAGWRRETMESIREVLECNGGKMRLAELLLEGRRLKVIREEPAAEQPKPGVEPPAGRGA
jgi:hypothetical protein